MQSIAYVSSAISAQLYALKACIYLYIAIMMKFDAYTHIAVAIYCQEI